MASGAGFVQDNWDLIYPLIMGVVAALAVMGAQSLATGAIAAISFMAANWPLLLIVAGVAMLTMALKQNGVTWQQIGQVVGAVFGALYTVGYTSVMYLWNLFATFAEFFANVFNDPVTAIVHLFSGLLDNILSVVQTAAQAIDALLGSDISGAVAGFRNDIQDFVNETVGENKVQIERMEPTDLMENITNFSETGENLGSKLDNMDFSLEDIAGGIGGLEDFAIPAAGDLNVGDVGTVGKVKSIDGDVNLSDEDIKLYRDLAERRYMNNVELQTLAPNITINVPKGAGGNINEQDLANKLKAILIQQRAAHTAVSHG